MSAGLSRRPIRRIDADPAADVPSGGWPTSVPAVGQVLREGLDLGGMTVVVGDNGSGKSTIVEGIAMAFGMSPEGGSTLAAHQTRSSESGLHEWLRVIRGVGGSRWGYFIRAETMHGLYTYLEANPGRAPESQFHEMSHGESVVSLVRSRMNRPGLYVLDEPEAGLSFDTSLALAAVLMDLGRDERSQVVLATHSPLLAAMPTAMILEAGPWGLRTAQWEQLPMVQHWQRFLGRPADYFRHL